MFMDVYGYFTGIYGLMSLGRRIRMLNSHNVTIAEELVDLHKWLGKHLDTSS